MVNVLLVGNGAREHAIAEALKRSRHAPKVYSYMSARNPGIAGLSEGIAIGPYSDFKAVLRFAKESAPEFALIGPENPIAEGLSDALEESGVPCVAPSKALAQLESSKSFARDLLEKHKIPGNPKYRTFTSMDGIREFMEGLGGEFVVKADGLRGGKGVKVVGDHLDGIEDGMEYCAKCIDEDGTVVVEEKFVGEEFSLQSFCDGEHVLDMIPVQDHKRAYEGDTGPNTGGMGSYSDANHLLPFLKREHLEQAHEISQMVCNAIRKETGEKFKGIMYGGFIVTKGGVGLIEYNIRFGDPEALNVLPIMKTDFVDVCRAVLGGTLDAIELEFENRATVCKYVVPEGYPDNPLNGEKIEIGGKPGSRMYYASVDQRDDGLYMSSSRALAFVGIADTLDEAEALAGKDISMVKGRIHYRKDIGTRELVQRRVEHMRQLEGSK